MVIPADHHRITSQYHVIHVSIIPVTSYKTNTSVYRHRYDPVYTGVCSTPKSLYWYIATYINLQGRAGGCSAESAHVRRLRRSSSR